MLPELTKDYDHKEVESRCVDLWEREKVYHYDPNSQKEVFSVDTPPPYVSASHLHVGHAMSYSQAEFIVRFQRMQGKNVFYPMGFDDNGLPTERFVEQKYKVNKRKTSRREFRDLCLKETAEGAKTYENLWKSLGISVDWRQRYSTIDEHCQRTAQASFIDLYEKGLIYRSDEPVLWDTHFESALAQADLETLSRKGKMYDLTYHSEDGEPLTISTTRPEKIGACVALYFHPEDPRYQHLKGKRAVVPMYEHTVPILMADDVDMQFGSGLMMVSTFPDGEDVKKWKRDKLDTRIVLETNGRMNARAGKYEGMTVEEARASIVKDLSAAGIITKTTIVDQKVPVSERSGVPVEMMLVPQWFIKVLDQKEAFLKRAEELDWNPPFMKVRLQDWIGGLKYDWNISRQRFYGVPVPVWYTKDGKIVLPPRDKLPVDPAEDKYPGTDYDPDELTGETDVLDTWMTSSLTPLINANWVESLGRDGTMQALYPQSIRVQGYEIIRTWLFYTLIKSHQHTSSLPWKSVMISGMGVDEQGKKISKRNLEQFTDPKTGYNRYNPESVISEFGADAFRFWAAGAQLGTDLKYNEKDVKAGRKLVVKLWNAARFALMQMEGFDPQKPLMPYADRTPEDRWLLNELSGVIQAMTKAFEGYDYARAQEQIERFFWMSFCDDYLEIIKDRFWKPERYSDTDRFSAQSTLWESLRALLGLLAPFIPFVTEELYQKIYQPFEGQTSLHITQWPKAAKDWEAEVPEMTLVLSVLKTVRSLRTARQISQNQPLKALIIDLGDGQGDVTARVQKMEHSLMAAARAQEIQYSPATTTINCLGLKIDILALESQAA